MTVLDFALTKHAMDRLMERNPDFALEVSQITQPALKKKAFYEYLAQAREEKAFLNNSTFMTMIGEKYGFHNKYRMFSKDDIVFVGVQNEGGNFIVTALTKSEHYVPHVKHRVQKFKKPEINTVEADASPCVPGRRRRRRT